MKKLIVILGPTASGKTDLTIKLAKKFNGEIICADSRQVYKEMVIGTASPCQENQESKVKIKKNLKPISIEEIPHHLLHIVYPNKEFNVAIYKKLAVKKIKDIQKRGKLPFLVGGTGLYIWAVVDNLRFPEVGPREKLRKELEKKSEKELFGIYKKLDPEGAKFIEKQNKRRLIRAIEVCKVTGNSFWKQRDRARQIFDVLQIGIKIEKEKLKERIIKRTDNMLKMGLEKETKGLFEKYGLIPPLQTIGYQEWLDFFKDKMKRTEVKEKIILHTLQFSKRQMTWFKKDNRIHWIKNQTEAEKLIEEFLKT